ncbi:hypothetical protein COP1_039805 [Malus domestica]
MKYNILRTISELSELVHTNFEDVEEVIRMDRRVGLHIDSNLGIGEQCLTNDLYYYKYILHHHGLKEDSEICKCLSKEGCDKLTIYDAKARREDIVRSLLWRAVFNKRVEIVVEAHRAWEGAHAIVFFVDSYEFEELPWGDIHETMGKPPFIFVGCNLNLNTVRTLGFNKT